MSSYKSQMYVILEQPNVCHPKQDKNISFYMGQMFVILKMAYISYTKGKIIGIILIWISTKKGLDTYHLKICMSVINKLVCSYLLLDPIKLYKAKCWM